MTSCNMPQALLMLPVYDSMQQSLLFGQASNQAQELALLTQPQHSFELAFLQFFQVPDVN